jgi:hypothetical protein
MNEKTFISLSNTYINLVANSVRELLENGIEFSLLVTKNTETSKYLPTNFYENKSDLLFDFTGWTFDEGKVNEYDITSLIAIDGPNGETGEFELNVPFMSVKAIIINEIQTVMVSRPFNITTIEKAHELSEPQVEVKTKALFDTSAFELSNSDGITHSMSKLKLCKPGE